MFKKALVLAAVATAVVVVMKRMQGAREDRELWKEAIKEPEVRAQLP